MNLQRLDRAVFRRLRVFLQPGPFAPGADLQLTKYGAQQIGNQLLGLFHLQAASFQHRLREQAAAVVLLHSNETEQETTAPLLFRTPAANEYPAELEVILFRCPTQSDYSIRAKCIAERGQKVGPHGSQSVAN